VEERLSWAKGRKAQKEEDMAYSLLGLLDVHMELRYGEGKDKAFRRLRKEIDKASTVSLPQRPKTDAPSNTPFTSFYAPGETQVFNFGGGYYFSDCVFEGTINFGRNVAQEDKSEGERAWTVPLSRGPITNAPSGTSSAFSFYTPEGTQTTIVGGGSTSSSNYPTRTTSSIYSFNAPGGTQVYSFRQWTLLQ
jgi:hypothetical protein